MPCERYRSTGELLTHATAKPLNKGGIDTNCRSILGLGDFERSFRAVAVHAGPLGGQGSINMLLLHRQVKTYRGAAANVEMGPQAESRMGAYLTSVANLASEQGAMYDE
jgi:hypothetical protein